ncbi:hypothetical protein [Neobacillus ginsengisoli]|uniref:Restriction endonuclease n=1 Tax=Neobacillus ginsengisoli TaxID=904295 RepID=A0ABT9XNK0_9BACI|nr:hypothetical protein [Neobacillus ginsengisoli]MDQ0197096.1 hypothetical protein [Neobacillus ginsengisoli]
MINWQFYPKSQRITADLEQVLKVFYKHSETIKSPERMLSSNDVLRVIKEDLEILHYKVESGKGNMVRVPVLYGKNGALEKSFNADAFNESLGIVIEVEAGRAVDNNQFLKDLFQACMMDGVSYLVIAVRNFYRTKANNSKGYKEDKDFEDINLFFETLYASARLDLPLSGILIIGY